MASLACGVTEAEWKAFHHVWNFLKEQLGPDAPAPVVHSEGNTYLIVDIGLRMLVPRELLNAQFSPRLAKHYILTGTDANQVKKIGNSVSPLPAAALIRANCGPEYRARSRVKAVA
jgi:DNA (cytosine-5)-methyltransferase 1